MSRFSFTWLCGSNAKHCFKEPSTSIFSSVDMRELIQQNQLIEQQIELDRLNAKETLKILFLGMCVDGVGEFFSFFNLGGPESGKSTLFKQMK